MRSLACLLLVLLLTSCCPHSSQRYSFEHRGPDLLRYDHIAGEVHVLRMGKWEKVAHPAPK